MICKARHDATGDGLRNNPGLDGWGGGDSANAWCGLAEEWRNGWMDGWMDGWMQVSESDQVPSYFTVYVDPGRVDSKRCVVERCGC